MIAPTPMKESANAPTPSATNLRPNAASMSAPHEIVILPLSLTRASVGRIAASGAESDSSMPRPRTIAPLAAVLLMLLAATPAQAGTSYRVRWGDTLTWIARDHHIALSRLAHVNGLDPYGVLVEGTVLRIP